MPPITVTGWPMVEVTFAGDANTDEVKQWLRQRDDLLAHAKPFGLLTQTLEDSHFSQEGRRELGLWFKQSRELLAKYCVGVSRLAPNPEAIERLAGPKMQAAMPCPIFASTEHEEAKAWLEEKLSA